MVPDKIKRISLKWSKRGRGREKDVRVRGGRVVDQTLISLDPLLLYIARIVHICGPTYSRLRGGKSLMYVVGKEFPQVFANVHQFAIVQINHLSTQ